MERRARLLLLLFTSTICLFLAVEIYWYNIDSYSTVPSSDIIASASTTTRAGNSRSTLVTDSDNGKSISIVKGQMVTFELPDDKYSPTHLEINGNHILIISPNNTLPAKGYFIESFIAAKTGITSITDNGLNILINVTN